MTKSSLLALFLFFAFSMNAQVSFYLRPTVNIKTNQGYFGGPWGPKSDYSSISNEYFTLVNKKMFLDNNIDLGINLGVQLKEKHFIELGISQDHSGLATSLLFNDMSYDEKTDKNIFRDNATYLSLIPMFSRISTTYSYNFWRSKSETLRLKAIVGLGVLFNSDVNTKKGDYKIGYHTGFAPGEIEPNVFINEHTVKTTEYFRTSAYLNFGFGVDVYSKKGKNLFTFDIFYLKGNKSIQYGENRIWVYDNNVEHIYSYGQRSKGSGIYFTLSRRFQVYPWIPLSKKKRTAGLL